jgi:hypothetical protein
VGKSRRLAIEFTSWDVWRTTLRLRQIGLIVSPHLDGFVLYASLNLSGYIAVILRSTPV